MKRTQIITMLLGIMLLVQCTAESTPGKTTTSIDTKDSKTAAQFTPWRGLVTVKSINFRTTPDPSAPLVRKHSTLYWRTEFDTIAEQGEWCQVRLDDGTEGWIRQVYEGKKYTGRIIEEYDERETKTKPINSAEFLQQIQAKALSWDKNARLDVLCGEIGALDGRCHKWTAIYRSSNKPGKKLYCAIYLNGLIVEEWESSWRVKGTSEPEIAPGYIWWDYENSNPPQSFISTSVLCSDENIKPIISSDLKVDQVSVFEQKDIDCVFALKGNSWEIVFNASIMGTLISQYDAQTGKYIGFRDNTMNE